MPKGRFKPFTKEHETFIVSNYLDLTLTAIAKHCGCRLPRIKRFLKSKGLEVPQEILDARKRKNHFKKGSVPTNKGKKWQEYMSEEAQSRCKATQFKKGGLPHNTKYDGAIVERKDNSGKVYLYYRVSKANWQLYHRVIWERKYGKIKKGYNIIFKDGNTKNININNLQMVSDEENMLRNSIHKFHPEIVPTMALCAKLNKLIKKQEYE